MCLEVNFCALTITINAPQPIDLYESYSQQITRKHAPAQRRRGILLIYVAAWPAD